MKTAIFAAATVLQVVAWAAIAGSLLYLLDGWAAWLVVSVVFLVFVLGWASAIGPHARWPLPAAWRFAGIGLTYLFAAEVLWFVAPWAGAAFAGAAVAVAALHLLVRRPARDRGTVSLGAGRGA